MPQFLEDRLKQEAARKGFTGKRADRYIFGTMNRIGAMRGSKETAKGRAMARKHRAKARRRGRSYNMRLGGFKTWLLAIAAAAAVSFPAFAQVIQSGSATAGHAYVIAAPSVVQDAGTSANGGFSSLGITNSGSCGLGINSTQPTNPYYQTCLGNGYLTFSAFGGASAVPFNIVVNGVTYPIGGTGWLSGIFDTQFCSTQGSVLFRASTAWQCLLPGTSGQVLTSQGGAQNPHWTAAPGTGTVTSIATGVGLTGGTITTSGTIATAGVLADLASITQAQGDIYYYNGSNLVALAPGTSGKVLETLGASANPQWANSPLVVGSSPIDNGTNGDIEYNNSGVLGELGLGTGVATALGNAVNATGGPLTYAIIGTSGATVPLLNGTNTLSGVTTFSNATNSSSTSTGAIVTSGGIGAAGNLNVGGSISMTTSGLGMYFGSSVNAADAYFYEGVNVFNLVAPASTNEVDIYKHDLSAKMLDVTPSSFSVMTVPSNTGAQSGYLCYNSSTGAITYDGTNTCLVSSRVFKNLDRYIEPASGLKTVMALKPIVYTYKRDKYPQLPGGTQEGFFAEDVAKVAPDLVATYPDGKPRSVKYDQITARLVAAIQEQQREIDALKAARLSAAPDPCSLRVFGSCWFKREEQ